MQTKQRLTKLLKPLLKKYNIRDEIRLQIRHNIPKRRRSGFRPLMTYYEYKKPIIVFYPNVPADKIERMPNWVLRKSLSHELVHHLCCTFSKSKDIKELKASLKKINRLIDQR